MKFSYILFFQKKIRNKTELYQVQLKLINLIYCGYLDLIGKIRLIEMIGLSPKKYEILERKVENKNWNYLGDNKLMPLLKDCSVVIIQVKLIRSILVDKYLKENPQRLKREFRFQFDENNNLVDYDKSMFLRLNKREARKVCEQLKIPYKQANRKTDLCNFIREYCENHYSQLKETDLSTQVDVEYFNAKRLKLATLDSSPNKSNSKESNIIDCNDNIQPNNGNKNGTNDNTLQFINHFLSLPSQDLSDGINQLDDPTQERDDDIIIVNHKTNEKLSFSTNNPKDSTENNNSVENNINNNEMPKKNRIKDLIIKFDNPTAHYFENKIMIRIPHLFNFPSVTVREVEEDLHKLSLNQIKKKHYLNSFQFLDILSQIILSGYIIEYGYLKSVCGLRDNEYIQIDEFFKEKFYLTTNSEAKFKKKFPSLNVCYHSLFRSYYFADLLRLKKVKHKDLTLKMQDNKMTNRASIEKHLALCTRLELENFARFLQIAKISLKDQELIKSIVEGLLSYHSNIFPSSSDTTETTKTTKTTPKKSTPIKKSNSDGGKKKSGKKQISQSLTPSPTEEIDFSLPQNLLHRFDNESEFPSLDSVSNIIIHESPSQRDTINHTNSSPITQQNPSFNQTPKNQNTFSQSNSSSTIPFSFDFSPSIVHNERVPSQIDLSSNNNDSLPSSINSNSIEKQEESQILDSLTLEQLKLLCHVRNLKVSGSAEALKSRIGFISTKIEKNIRLFLKANDNLKESFKKPFD